MALRRLLWIPNRNIAKPDGGISSGVQGSVEVLAIQNQVRPNSQNPMQASTAGFPFWSDLVRLSSTFGALVAILDILTTD